MSQHMDMQMLQQQWMEAQAMGDIYKNGCKNYCVCMCVLKGVPQVGMKSFALATSQTFHGLKATCLWQMSSLGSLYQE